MSSQTNSQFMLQENSMPNFRFDNASLEEIDNGDAIITLLVNGMVLNCNESACRLLGCNSGELNWQTIARLLPKLAEMSLIVDEKVNPYLRFLSIAGHQFEVTCVNGEHFSTELYFYLVEKFGNCCMRIILKPARQKAATKLSYLRTY